MVKDILAVAVTIGTLAIGTISIFWGVPWLQPGVAKAQSAKPAVAEVEAVKVHGTIKAIDKDKRTVTLMGPRGGTLTLSVRDPQKLDAVKVGDPVVATYYEALVIQVRPAGSATPGVSVTDTRATSKPGENPAGAVESEVTVTASVASVDATKGTVTIKGLQGDTETVKARDPKMLTGVKSGDLVQLTYRRAFAVALDRPAGN